MREGFHWDRSLVGLHERQEVASKQLKKYFTVLLKTFPVAKLLVFAQYQR